MRIARSTHAILRRVGRGLLALALLPAMLCGPFGTMAVMIHGHDGHDTHVHAFTQQDTGPRPPSNRVEAHVEDVDGIMIVFDTVVAVRADSHLRINEFSLASSSTSLSVAAASSQTDALTPDVGTHDRPFAPGLRASGRIAALLQSNHALLF